MSPSASTPNLFAGAGVARIGDDFTDRARERAFIGRALRTPRGHLVVVGPRRIGKSSLLRAVQDDVARKKGPPVLYIDLWTASTIEDMTTRLAAAAARALGRRWTDLVRTLAQRLEFKFEVSEQAGGVLVPVPIIGLRDAPRSDQRTRLVDALDTLDDLARSHKVHLGVILDEFQEIERLGNDPDTTPGTGAMRQLRAAIQHHAHVTYIFAGSDRVLIDRLHAPKDGPLHNLARRYEIGPIDPVHLAKWLEERFAKMGIRATGRGEEVIALAGPRTRDVRTLAETAADRARGTRTLAPAALTEAMVEIAQQRRSQYETDWKALTALQQNCLRAVASGEVRLTAAAVRTHFALGDTSRTAKSLATLVDRDILLRDGTRFAFDDPFYRTWVAVTTLGDVGARPGRIAATTAAKKA